MALKKRIDKAFPADTLLKQFINREIDSYDEPVRKGRPRGDSIGLSLPMFTAAVLSGVTNLQLKEISQISGANYGSLRNSVGNEQFLEIAIEDQGSFSIYIAEYLKQRIAELQQAMNERKDFYEAIAAIQPLFDDARLYREETFRQICRVYFLEFTSAPDLIACPRAIFTRVVRTVFHHIDYARRIAERAFLDRVNEFLRLNKGQFLSGKPHPDIGNLSMLYIDAEARYHEEWPG